MFICQGLNPYTRQPLDLFHWGALEPFVESTRRGVSLVASGTERVSRIGGAPEFVDDWPQGSSGPVPFICQLDLAELAAQAGSAWPDGFPETGVVSLFFDEAAAVAGAQSQRHQFALVVDSGTRRRPARGASCTTSYSSVALEAARDPHTGPDHQFGGAPDWIQAPHAAAGHYKSGAYLQYPDVVAALRDAGLDERCFLLGHDAIIAAGHQLDARGIEPARIAASLRDWHLIVQVDADPSIGLLLGDMGRLYVFADLRSIQLASTPIAWIEFQYH